MKICCGCQSQRDTVNVGAIACDRCTNFKSIHLCLNCVREAFQRFQFKKIPEQFKNENIKPS